MEGALLNLFFSVLAGIISGFAILPIASDALRGKIFGGRKRAIQGAQKELFETIQGMSLNGQIITQYTFEKLVENVSSKYEIPASTLGDKDNNIAMVLQAINSSEVLPHWLKRQLSEQLQMQFGDHESDNIHIGGIDIENDVTREIISEWGERNKNREAYNNSSRMEKILVLYIAVGVGGCIAYVAYHLNNYTLFPILLCIAAFLVCVNILTSLIGTSEPKDIEFFRKLVYKLIFIIVLIVFAIVLIVFIT